LCQILLDTPFSLEEEYREIFLVVSPSQVTLEFISELNIHGGVP
jgi:hypothetical protein